jgi:ubiquinone/menaquinone biosynthesis C-methylase UbiE
VPSLNDPDDVAREYSSEHGLRARRSLYDGLVGEDVKEVLFDTVLEHTPTSVLEIGSGTGELAQRLGDAGISDYTAIDLSPRMVELTRARGVAAELGDVQQLQFADRRFDCVIAAWMLYHVPDLNLALAEVARVLRPGGCLIAATNSVRHLAELWSLVGHERWGLPFTAENGRELLARHFGEVHSRDVEAWLTLSDQHAARDYIKASPARAHLADSVAALSEPLSVGARTCVFVATAPLSRS